MISCERECILFIILKEGSSVRLRALGAPANYVSLHGMQKERKGTFGAPFVEFASRPNKLC